MGTKKKGKKDVDTSEESSSESGDDQAKPLIKTVKEFDNKSAEDSEYISQSKLDKSSFKSPSPKQASKTTVKNGHYSNSMKGAASQSSQVNSSQKTPSQLTSTIMMDKK